MRQLFKNCRPERYYRVLVLLVILIFTLVKSPSFGQDMSQGFQHLEKGEFEKAERFFLSVLEEFPNNKTAKLCYGRSVGLLGKAEKAIDIFEELEKESPENLEVLLNLAEANLWKNDGSAALAVFQQITRQDSTLFPAWLGVANSYSQLKEYPQAYNNILKALELDPSNAQAQTSKKYIILGYANQLSSQEAEYEKALELLQENLNFDASDQESLYLKASIQTVDKEYQAAIETYKQLSDGFQSLMGQSTVHHLMKENKTALLLAEEALEMITPATDSKMAFRVKMHYLNALLWNGQQMEARSFLDTLHHQSSDNQKVLLAAARVAIYDSDYIKGAGHYEDFLIENPDSFEGNLGRADAYHALGRDRQAYQGGFKTLDYYPNQVDATQFVRNLNHSHSPSIAGGYELNFSSDGSHNRTLTLMGKTSLSPVTNLQVNYRQKNYFDEGVDNSSQSNWLSATLSHQLSNRTKLGASFGLFQSIPESDTEASNTTNIARVEVQYLVSRSQTTTVGYYSEVQDFNRALFSRQLKTDHLFLKNSLYFKSPGWGNYTELLRTYFSDDNRRDLLFTSFYKSLGKDNFLKTGINLLKINFLESRPTEYFSPSKYHQVEVFAGLTKLLQEQNQLKLEIESAIGQQWVETNQEFTWRGKISLNGQFSRIKAKLYCQYSSTASSSFNNFSNFIVGGQVEIRLSSKPIFYRKLVKSISSQKIQE